MLNPHVDWAATIHIASPKRLIWLDTVEGMQTWHLQDGFLGSLWHFLKHFRMLRHVFAIVFTVTVLLSSLQTLHIILLEEFHLVLTVEIVSQLWHRKIMNCSQ